MPKGTFGVTTPIYYINAAPHLGTAYTTVAADTIARYERMNGYDVSFVPGTDEHGQKIAETAEKNGMTPQAWCDSLAPAFTDAWKTLDIDYTNFVRTTEDRQTRAVQKFWQGLYDAGWLYKSAYEGWYCVHEETYYAESDLEKNEDGEFVCPDCKRPVRYESSGEENWFFKLSEFQDKLLAFYDEHPDFIRPVSRRNEIVSFVKGGLQDLSISRSSFDWGIPVPWDEGHVFYVWADALIAYLTGIGYGDPEREAEFDRRWPIQYHFVGKDITRFHCVIWPAMLMAAGMPITHTVFGHGFLLTKGEKMSKSKGNVVRPQEINDKYGAEILRLWVASTDYSGELRLGPTIINRVVESYRRIRNTLRFLLANTSDFSMEKDAVPVEDMLELDRWAVAYAADFQKRVLVEYGSYRFHNVVTLLQTFASTDLGSFYLDVLKDRLYTTGAQSFARRSAQTALYLITAMLLRLIAPILSFTAEEAFKLFSPNADETIFTETFLKLPEVKDADALLAKWAQIRAVRADVQKAIEDERTSGTIGSSLQTTGEICAASPLYEVLASLGDELRFVMIMSEVKLTKAVDGAETTVSVKPSTEKKCERCWHYVPGVGSNAEHPTLCPRCVSNLFGAGEKRLFA